MADTKNMSLLGTATVYVGAFAAYLAGIEPIVDNFQKICDKLAVSKAMGAAIVLIPLLFAAGFWIKSRVVDWFNRRTFANSGGYQANTFRLRPFVQSERDIAQYRTRSRADGLEEEIVEWLLNADDPILFLTGKSGTGKSSLLAAAVLPALKEQKPSMQICSLRIYNNPLVDVQQSLEKFCEIEKTPAEKCSTQRIRALLESSALRSPVLLVIDQFEELLILHSAEQREPFEELLKNLVAQPIAHLHVLLVCREDYLPELEQARRFLPSLRSHSNWRQVGLFKQNMATVFLKSAGITIGSQLMEKLLTEASDAEETKGQYRPIVLNMLGLSLERNLRPQGKRFFGGSASLLRQLVESELGNDESCRQVLTPMITDKGTKRALSAADIANESKISPAATDAALRKLEISGLVRQLNEAEQIWEISHDFIARILSGLLATWKTSILRRIKPWVIPAISLVIVIALSVPESNEKKILFCY